MKTFCSKICCFFRFVFNRNDPFYIIHCPWSYFPHEIFRFTKRKFQLKNGNDTPPPLLYFNALYHTFIRAISTLFVWLSQNDSLKSSTLPAKTAKKKTHNNTLYIQERLDSLRACRVFPEALTKQRAFSWEISRCFAPCLTKRNPSSAKTTRRAGRPRNRTSWIASRDTIRDRRKSIFPTCHARNPIWKDVHLSIHACWITTEFPGAPYRTTQRHLQCDLHIHNGIAAGMYRVIKKTVGRLIGQIVQNVLMNMASQMPP